ncbi:TetR/AcrR family transcriptional regulator [Saccharopolyspora sp. NPDC000359]|uniref:TetR/AcrR family transcriptional regulator n=1 Tax=Saccharopolyspora sp. NPDC000359 TaxID=3154251 RepID=UPI00331EECB1
MAELLRVHGYAATSIQQLAHAAEVPVGSIYHHFPGGKREVAAAALRQSGAAYILLLQVLLDRHTDLPTGIEEAFTAAAEDMESVGWANMCPVATVTGEVAEAEPALRETGAEVIESWLDHGVQYFAERGLHEHDARALMSALLSALQGGFLLARGQQSKAPLITAGRAVASFAATLPITAPVSNEDRPAQDDY